MEVSGTRWLQSVWLIVCCLVSLSCDSLSARSNKAEDRAGLDRCDGEPKITRLHWDDDSELGTPAQAFANIEGQCQGELRWSSDAEAKPKPSDNASMQVKVELDHASARLVQHTDNTGARSGCSTELTVDAQVALQSDDAAVDVDEQVEVRYLPDAPITFGFHLTPDEHRGTLMVQERKGETSMLSFELDGAGSNCAGEIMVSTTSTSGDGTMHGLGGRIGSWSASGCAVGQTPFDIEAAIGDSTLPMLIVDTWDGRELEGSWQDGAQTKLSLQVEPLAAVSCAEQRAGTRTVTQPVEVRYSTDDGRLTERTTTANVRAQLTPENELSALSLWISDEMTCSTTDSQLSYTPADCTQMKAATVQLALSRSGSGDADTTSRAGLSVYFIPRFGDDEPDQDTLSLR